MKMISPLSRVTMLVSLAANVSGRPLNATTFSPRPFTPRPWPPPADESLRYVTVCNSYGHAGCGSGMTRHGTLARCSTITLMPGTWASVPGTACWYVTNEHGVRLDPILADPLTAVPNIVFCNRPGGQGQCTTGGQCLISPLDESCQAIGTESMTIYITVE